MVDDGTFVKNADIVVRAGANANATAITTTETDKYVLDVENYINVYCNYDFTTNYASMSTSTKYLLKETAACLCAIYVIQYDMSGYTSIAEALNMLNVLHDKAQQDLQLLKTTAAQDMMRV